MGRHARFPTLVAAALAACLGVTDEDPPIVIWGAVLVPAPQYPEVTGQVAAVSQPDGTAVGIAIDGADAGALLRWGIRTGTCVVPGLQVGPDSDYPELEVDLSGSVEGETHLGPRLSLSNSYHAEVRAADASRIACGDLEAG